VYPPGPPKQVKGNFAGAPEDWANGIRSRVTTFVGSATVGYKFNEGDPIGLYKLVIFVDGTETAAIEFNIVDGGQ
jgi:hypothetical protein